MKRLVSFLSFLLLSSALLFGYVAVEPEAAPAPESTAEAAPEPAAAPTPEPTPATATYNGVVLDESIESLTLRPDSDPEALAALAGQLPGLNRIDFGSRTPSAEELAMLRTAFPAAEIQYRVSIGGQTFSWDVEELDLSFLPRDGVEEAIKTLPLLEELRAVELGAASEQDGEALTLEDVRQFQEAFPELAFDYHFSLFGVELSTLDETLNFQGVKMNDEGEAVRAILPCMTRCTTLDMDSCGVSNEAMAAIRDDFPDIKVVWLVSFGHSYGARTDTTRIWINGLGTEGAKNLKYCTEVKYLDLGHSHIADISFVSYMPNLEVAVLSINTFSDVSPLASCKNLEYLEMFRTECTDLSPLAELTNLKHLNIHCIPELKDISPLYGMTSLERLWVGSVNKIPQEQKEAILERLPDCDINFTVSDPTGDGWREHPRYELLSRQFDYENYGFSYIRNAH